MEKTWVACMSCGAVNRVPSDRVDEHPKCGSCKSGLPIHGSLIDQNSKSLPNLIRTADKPIVVDFWAPWCGPCVSFAPTFETASKQFGKDFIFVKVNTESDPNAGGLYGVRGIPTLVVFAQGKELQRISGALPAAQFAQWLTQAKNSIVAAYTSRASV